MRRWMLLLALAVAPAAHAELTCEQVGKVILATLDYRDQGYSITQVMASVDQLKVANHFTDEELAKLRAVVKLSFLQTRTPKELLDACQEDEEAAKKKK